MNFWIPKTFWIFRTIFFVRIGFWIVQDLCNVRINTISVHWYSASDKRSDVANDIVN